MLLVMFQVWKRIAGVNPQVFPASTWEQGHCFLFFNFQILDYRIFKYIKANPCGFILDNNKGPPNKCAKFHWNTWNQMAEAMILQ